MATHSSILAWRIPWGHKRVGHNLATEKKQNFPAPHWLVQKKTHDLSITNQGFLEGLIRMPKVKSLSFWDFWLPIPHKPGAFLESCVTMWNNISKPKSRQESFSPCPGRETQKQRFLLILFDCLHPLIQSCLNLPLLGSFQLCELVDYFFYFLFFCYFCYFQFELEFTTKRVN